LDEKPAEVMPLAGSICAESSLSVHAGRDLNVTSTTQSSAGNAGGYSFSQSGIDRVAGAVTTTALGAAVNAGFASLAAQAAVAMVNNGGDIGKTLQQLGSEQSIKGLLTTMATAGALQSLDKAMGFDSTQTATGQTGNAATGVNGVATSQAANAFQQNLLKNVTNNVAGSAIDAAINGKAFDEKALSSALSSALVTAGMAAGANAIGDASTGNNGNPAQLDAFTQKLAHAVLGCAGGAAVASSGGGCSAGALGAVVGEMAANFYLKKNEDSNLSLDQNKANALAFAKVMSATAGVLAGGGDDNVAAVNVANTTGENAALNNTLYHYNGKIIARDSKNNNKLVNLSASDLQTIAAAENAVLMKDVAGVQASDINLPQISDAWAQQIPSSTTYNLENAKDRATLQGLTDMGYLNIDNRSTTVYVETGMKTTMSDAIQNAQKAEGVLRIPVGAIVNGTQGLGGDIDKFLPNNATLTDALNEYTYRTLNDKGPTLIVTHSAGNNDATKTMQLGTQLGNRYPNLSFLSLASPISSSVMQTAVSNVGASFLGQVNDWRDPVTSPKLWVLGTAGMLVGGAAAGVAFAPATGGGSLYSYFTALIGGGVGGGAGVYGIENIHPFANYIAKPTSQSIMFDWMKKNQK
jgi:filamentous hemagglutinin